MRLDFRAIVIGLVGAALLGAGAARAGDDGAAPIWEGIYSIVGPFAGFDKDEKPPIDYHEHGKIVVPKSMDLPAPAPAATGDAWPVNQEILRKRAQAKDKDSIAPGAPAKIRANSRLPQCARHRARRRSARRSGRIRPERPVHGSREPQSPRMGWDGQEQRAARP